MKIGYAHDLLEIMHFYVFNDLSMNCPNNTSDRQLNKYYFKRQKFIMPFLICDSFTTYGAIQMCF